MGFFRLLTLVGSHDNLTELFTEKDKTPTQLMTPRLALALDHRTFGRLDLEPEDCWTLDAARDLHDRFHGEERESTTEYYTNAVVFEALRDLPTQPGQLRAIYPKVWDLLRRWGRVQGLTKKESRDMLKTLNSHGRLPQLLRGHSLEEDLSKLVKFKGERRTLANWMQVILRDVSHQRRHEVVASTKLLHAPIPKLFPMFDNQMSNKFFGAAPSVPVYCGLFLPLAQSQIDWLRKANVKPYENHTCRRSWAKLIDEINWT